MTRGYRAFASILQEQGSSDKKILFDESYSVLCAGGENPPLLGTEHVFQTALVGHTIKTKLSTVLSNNIMEKEYHMK